MGGGKKKEEEKEKKQIPLCESMVIDSFWAAAQKAEK